MSFSALVAKVGQSEAPSSLTATIFWPITPPLALISSMASWVELATVISEMAMVPVSE